MRTLLYITVLTLSALAQQDSQPAPIVSADELWLKLSLSGSRRLLCLVTAPFNVPTGTPAPVDSNVRLIETVFANDLAFSLHFTFARPDTGSHFRFSTDQRRPDLRGWATTGAQVLICADLLTKRSGNHLQLRLYDLASSRLIATKAYPLTLTGRWLAHQMADEVIKLLTGEDGVSCTRIAFSQALGQERKELAWVDYDGASQTLLTNSGGLKLFPDWSPRGDRIAYCSYGPASLNIYALELSSRRTSPITERPGLNTTPAYSPDGRRLAVSLSFEGQSEVYVMDVDGRHPRRLTASPGIDISPCWDPSGRQIAFVSDRSGTPQVYVMNADGTDTRRITFEGTYNTSPAWSPRGDLIAFVQRQQDGSNQICVTNILGDTYMRLTSLRNNEDPCWSPDGLHIAFASNRTGAWEIYTMDWNGANQQQVTRTGGAFSPTWSPRLSR